MIDGNRNPFLVCNDGSRWVGFVITVVTVATVVTVCQIRYVQHDCVRGGLFVG